MSRPAADPPASDPQRTDRSDDPAAMAGVLFDRGLDAFGGVVGQVAEADWDRPSPCEGWTALDVLGHLGTSVAMGTSLLRGEQPSWPQVDRPADVVVGDPAEFWNGLAAQAREALVGTDLDLVMDTPMGPRTVADRLAFPAVDLYVHAWDIGQAVGLPVEIPDDVIALAHHHIDPIPDDKVRGPQGAFGAEVPAPDGATPSEAFIAWTGRRPL
jgi:uncharacterized protein (TIGR03086 family)